MVKEIVHDPMFLGQKSVYAIVIRITKTQKMQLKMTPCGIGTQLNTTH